MNKYSLKVPTNARHFFIKDSTVFSRQAFCFRQNKLEYGCLGYDRLIEFSCTFFEDDIYLSTHIPYKKRSIDVLILEQI